MKIIVIFIFIVISYSQPTSFSIYGVGENIQNNDPAALSMGNGEFFAGNFKNISNESPSSLWRTSLTRFSVFSGLNVLKGGENSADFQQNLTSFSLHFPVGLKRVLGFGVQPLYRSREININSNDYKYIGADQAGSELPITYKENYFINGGISEFFIEYSQKIGSFFSTGIKYSGLFGLQTLENKLFSYDVIVDSINSGLIIDKFIEEGDTLFVKAINEHIINVNEYRNFSASKLILEGRYFIKSHEIVFRSSLNSGVKVQTQHNQMTNNEEHNSSFIDYSKPILSELSFGYQYKLKYNSGFSFELHRKYPFNAPGNSFLFNITPPDQKSLHLGCFYQITNSKLGFWNNINLRSGVFFEELDFSNDIYLNYGITIGAGIEYFTNSQSIDITFRLGQRESRIIYNEFEQYFNIDIGLITGEKWFMKRKRK